MSIFLYMYDHGCIHKLYMAEIVMYWLSKLVSSATSGKLFILQTLENTTKVAKGNQFHCYQLFARGRTSSEKK